MLRDLIEYLQIEREMLTWISFDVTGGNTGLGKKYYTQSASSMVSSIRYDRLEKDREYGLASTIVGTNWYIQQIDCKTQDLDLLVGFLETFKRDYRIYSTGNSFHVYFRKLANSVDSCNWFDRRDLTTYLAELILADKDSLLDHRWIAHCLVDKCTALRFTQHQGVKLMVPELVYDKRFR